MFDLFFDVLISFLSMPLMIYFFASGIVLGVILLIKRLV